MRALVSEEKEEIAGSISLSIPLLDRSIDTEDLVNKFVIEEDVVKKYEEARKWEAELSDKQFPAFSIGYVVLLGLAFIFEMIYRPSVVDPIVIYASVIIVTVIIILLLFIGKQICKRIADNQHVDHDEAIYHRLARSIQEYKDGNYDNSIKEVESAKRLIKYGDTYPFAPEFTIELYKYIDKVEEKSSQNFYKETYPEVANKTLHSLASVYTSDFEYVYSERTNLEQVEDFTLPKMLRDYVTGFSENRYVRMLGPYVVSAPIIYAVYLQSETTAQILTVVIVAIVQTYNRPDATN